jgi:hypothetical protein
VAFVDDALQLLGSFTRFLREEYPDLADKLTTPALKWAMREGIAISKLAEVLRESESTSKPTGPAT